MRSDGIFHCRAITLGEGPEKEAERIVRKSMKGGRGGSAVGKRRGETRGRQYESDRNLVPSRGEMGAKKAAWTRLRSAARLGEPFCYSGHQQRDRVGVGVEGALSSVVDL